MDCCICAVWKPRLGYARTRRPNPGFTLVEMLVVIAIIGILTALLLPAVQYAREAGRRTACGNNLHQQVLALHQYHASFNRFPLGKSSGYIDETSWFLDMLPFLEQGATSGRFDRQKRWDDATGNVEVANSTLAVLECPSSLVQFPGDSDYGGLAGSALTAPDWSSAFDNGVIIHGTGMMKRITFASVLDGTSQTICIAESADRPENEGGRWISGQNCFSHDNGALSRFNGGEIYSQHRVGASVALTDGSTRFLSRSIDLYVLGALCTRDLGEVIDAGSY